MNVIGNLTENEKTVLGWYHEHVEETDRLYKKKFIEKVERKSDKEYDLRLEGYEEFYWKHDQTINWQEGEKSGSITVPQNEVHKTKYSAWLPLAIIKTFTNWTSPKIAKMTDYPDMTRSGDWSGLRDSSEKKIWAIFYHCFFN